MGFVGFIYVSHWEPLDEEIGAWVRGVVQAYYKVRCQQFHRAYLKPTGVLLCWRGFIAGVGFVGFICLP